jgi:hypothetical protein
VLRNPETTRTLGCEHHGSPERLGQILTEMQQNIAGTVGKKGTEIAAVGQ